MACASLRRPQMAVPAARPYGDTTWLKELYDLFAPVRQEVLERGDTEEEVNGWIDEALAEVRAGQRSPADRTGDDELRFRHRHLRPLIVEPAKPLGPSRL